MTAIKKVIEAVRKKVTPTARERKDMEKVIDKVVDITKQAIKPLGLGYTLAGSFIRDTWMPDKKEFEVFILFPETASREKLEKQGLEVGKGIIDSLNGSYVIAYAEHPYVRARVLGYDIDIVPCYKLKSADKIKSAVDRTPFHNRWISRNLPEKLASEVRLLKRFAKALGVYGSDTRVQGFSGYLCELLIVHCGSFEALAKQAAEWEPGRVFIDLQKHHKAGRVPEDLKQRFKNQPLVVIDPVDRNRNVAAAFSPENFARFVLACERFVKRPSEEFFFPVAAKVEPSKLRKCIEERGSKFLAIEFQRPDVIDDVLWPQLRRTANRLKDIMAGQDFLVLDWAVHSDLADLGRELDGNKKQTGKSYIMLELGVWRLPRIRRVVGPPVFIRQRAKEFRKKYQKTGRVWVEGDRLVSEVKREFLDARAKLEHSLSDPVKELKAKGIASHIAESIAGKPGAKCSGSGFKIIEEEQMLGLAAKDRQFGLFLKKYLDRE